MAINQTNEIQALKKCIHQLEDENRYLKNILKEAGLLPEEYDDDNRPVPIEQESTPVILPPLTQYMAKQFFAYFWGRTDVFAKRFVSKNGHAGYYPQCQNIWLYGCPKRENRSFSCKDCPNKSWKPLTVDLLMEHFAGLKQNTSDVIGIYPLLPDQTTRLLVFDFDEHETIHLTNDQMSLEEEVAALRKICSKNNIPHLTERSRSGKGVHVWIFFEKPILASIARHFGQLLLDNGAEQVNLKSFLTYDRMLPAQDSLKDGAIGNLVALPWQGQALLQGNTCFVDENMMPYTDQWTVLKQTGKLSEETVRGLINQWTNHSDDEKPWNQAPSFNASDVLGIMEITLANAIYVKKTNLRPRIQNQIRRMAR